MAENHDKRARRKSRRGKQRRTASDPPADAQTTDPSTPIERATEPSLSIPSRRSADSSSSPSSSSGGSHEDSRRRARTAVSRRQADDSRPIDEHVGKTLGGKYRLDKLIAKGGMGRVYQATQFPLERPVAIKILNAEFQRSDPQFVKRFFLEASIAAKLAHPNTITVFDYGEGEGGELYIAMELLRGRSLSRVISKQGPFEPVTCLKIGSQVCRALREAHDAGIIHRDLKPGNIFLLEADGEVPFAKVLDFGLVKLFTPEQNGEPLGNLLGAVDPELTRTGTLLGSPKYMSPEQIQGHQLDPRTDIYSFGVILFQMVAGQPPFTGATGVDVIYKHVNHPVPPIRGVNPDVTCPPEVERIIQRCLEKSPDKRYSSMSVLIDDLKGALALLTNSSLSESRDLSRATSAHVAAEASFREALSPEEPTPTGLAPSEGMSGPSQPPSRAPVIIAALGFMVALATLGYVLTAMPRRATSPEPSTTPESPPAATTAVPTTPSAARPQPPAPPPQPATGAVSVETEAPSQTALPAATAEPVDEEPEPEVEPTPPRPVKRSTSRRTKRRRRAPPPPPVVEEAKDPGDLDADSTYRDNPY